MKNNIPTKEPISFYVLCDATAAKRLQQMQPYFSQMALANCIELGERVVRPERSIAIFHRSVPNSSDMDIYVDISQFFDVDSERKRLEKQRDELAKFIRSIDAKLGNKGFVDRAPAELVQQQREKLTELEGQLAAVKVDLEKLR